MQHSPQENHRPSPFFVHGNEPREGQRKGQGLPPQPHSRPQSSQPPRELRGLSWRTQVCWPTTRTREQPFHANVLMTSCTLGCKGVGPRDKAGLQRQRDGMELTDVTNTHWAITRCLNSGIQPGLKPGGVGVPMRLFVMSTPGSCTGWKHQECCEMQAGDPLPARGLRSGVPKTVACRVKPEGRVQGGQSEGAGPQHSRQKGCHRQIS